METTQTTKLPEFRGKPLIENYSAIPTADFLREEFGNAVYQQAKEIAKSDYKDNPALNIARYEKNLVTGSNPFYVVLINQVIKNQKLRTATPKDLEKILKINALNLNGFYEDSALILRTNGDSDYNANDYLAKNLTEQIREIKGKKFKYPVMLHLKDLGLANDSNSEYRLSFKIREDAEIIHSQKLNHSNNQKMFSETDNDGLPVFSKDGARTFYTRDNGLSRLCLRRDLVLGSYWCNSLADSGSNGRVVIVSDAVSEKNSVLF